jgi:hypothetical protein
MTVKLYVDVDGVLLRRRVRADGRKRGFELARYGFQFMSWAVLAFECRWLTRLDRRGGDYRIRRAFRLALGVPQFDNDLEVFFHCVKPTYWEGCMAEAIGLDGGFYWIARDPDARSLAVLRRRGLMKRLILCSGKDDPQEFARIRLQLEGFAE